MKKQAMVLMLALAGFSTSVSAVAMRPATFGQRFKAGVNKHWKKAAIIAAALAALGYTGAGAYGYYDGSRYAGGQHDNMTHWADRNPYTRYINPFALGAGLHEATHDLAWTQRAESIARAANAQASEDAREFHVARDGSPDMAARRKASKKTFGSGLLADIRHAVTPGRMHRNPSRAKFFKPENTDAAKKWVQDDEGNWVQAQA